MTLARRVMSSSYMHWAKTSSTANFNLATSGMANLKLRDLRVTLDDLEITEGGYGYQPLIQAIAAVSRGRRFDSDRSRYYVRQSPRNGRACESGR